MRRVFLPRATSRKVSYDVAARAAWSSVGASWRVRQLDGLDLVATAKAAPGLISPPGPVQGAIEPRPRTAVNARRQCASQARAAASSEDGSHESWGFAKSAEWWPRTGRRQRCSPVGKARQSSLLSHRRPGRFTFRVMYRRRRRAGSQFCPKAMREKKRSGVRALTSPVGGSASPSVPPCRAARFPVRSAQTETIRRVEALSNVHRAGCSEPAQQHAHFRESIDWRLRG
jgi:hypothetical protein